MANAKILLIQIRLRWSSGQIFRNLFYVTQICLLTLLLTISGRTISFDMISDRQSQLYFQCIWKKILDSSSGFTQILTAPALA